MTNFRITLKNQTRKELEKLFRVARNRGDLAAVKRNIAIIAITECDTYLQVSTILRVSKESLRLWVKDFF